MCLYSMDVIHNIILVHVLYTNKWYVYLYSKEESVRRFNKELLYIWAYTLAVWPLTFSFLLRFDRLYQRTFDYYNR